MSGTNPFRRRDISQASPAQPDREANGGDPVNPVEYSRARDGHGISAITSPSGQAFVNSSPADFESPSSEEPSPIDPFSPQSDEGTSQDDDEDLRRNTIANATSTTPQAPFELKLPVNPIRKAPALQFGGDASTLGHVAQPEQAAPAPPPGTNRPHYDVDDFKRLLLTGEKLRPNQTTPTSTPPVHAQGLQLGDNNSNTDASSVSRQSIFEPHPEAHPESPGTSMDASLSDDEHHGLVQQSPHGGRNRPSVPPSRHGKLVKQHVPQTVPFESLSSSPPRPKLPSSQSMEPVSPPSPNALRNLNKPLPLPPRSESPKPIEPSADRFSSVAEKPGPSLASPQDLGQPATKKNPPALPAVRRHGQTRSRSSTNDSSRSTSISEEHFQTTYPSPSNSSSTTASKPPPLPPPRRAGTNPAQENSSPVSSTFPAVDAVDQPSFKHRPSMPPSRTPSTSSIKQLSRIASSSGSSGIAPPPPPRRRGSSQSQSIFMPSRLSGEYRMSDNERVRSGSGASSTHQPSVAEGQTQGKDIMADLTALQKEVDELRGKFSR
ncbi:MAG: hypothetical protein Q9219_001475 [cf. Caloplaca sp. 3 TL-2023]